MNKWSFSDDAIGHLAPCRERLNSDAEVLKPPSVPEDEWFDFCVTLCRLLNMDTPLLPIIARVASENERLQARVTELLEANNIMLEQLRAAKREARSDG